MKDVKEVRVSDTYAGLESSLPSDPLVGHLEGDEGEQDWLPPASPGEPPKINSEVPSPPVGGSLTERIALVRTPPSYKDIHLFPSPVYYFPAPW